MTNPCKECVNLTKDKIKCSIKCEKLSEYQDYLLGNKGVSTDQNYNVHSEHGMSITPRHQRYFF